LKHLLLPLDGSASAERILPYGLFIAQRFEADVTLLHIIEAEAPRTVHGQRHLRTQGEATAYLGSLAEKYASTGVPIHIHVHEEALEDPIQGIRSHEEELKVDLIILSVHGHLNTRRLFRGNVAQRIFAESTKPILLVKKPELLEDIICLQRILVPTGEDAHQEQALRAAREWAGPCDAELDLVRVVRTPDTLKVERRVAARLLPRTAEDLFELEQHSAQGDLESAANALKAQGYEVRTFYDTGDPVRIIKKIAVREKSDLVILASHGKRGTSAFIDQSVGNRLVQTLHTPILMVPLSREDT
jgi:nucleotide-binding universal stress UspA family protein